MSENDNFVFEIADALDFFENINFEVAWNFGSNPVGFEETIERAKEGGARTIGDLSMEEFFESLGGDKGKVLFDYAPKKPVISVNLTKDSPLVNEAEKLLGTGMKEQHIWGNLVVDHLVSLADAQRLVKWAKEKK